MQALESGDPQQVGGYRLLARLGAGGMGRVYLARSRGGRRVALKVIRAELADDQDFRARFAREVASAKAVGGAFTVAVLDADATAETPWLATEYVAGPSLSEAVREHGPLPVESVRALAAGLAEALLAIHRAGVIHRDLKPSNVLLAADGPRVIDFGISRAVEATELTRTGMIVGSPGFMSPEQIEGRPVTPAADVFSLGAVLAYAASGAGPFGEGATPSLLYRVVHSEPQLEPVPAELRDLVGACLRKDPAARPSPDALLDLLEAAEGEEAHDPTVMWLPSELTGMIARVEAERPSALEPAAGDPGPAATAETLPVPPVVPVGFGPAPEMTTPRPAAPASAQAQAPVLAPASAAAPALAGFATEGPPTAPTAPLRVTAAVNPERPPRRRAPLVLAAALLLLAAGGGVVYANMGNSGSPRANPPATGPQAGTTGTASATASATPSGTPSATASATASAGGGGSTANTVYLTVPTVTGQPVDYAKQLLTDKGFRSGSIKVSYHCTSAGPGVYAQSPSAGSQVPQDSVIRLSASEDDCVAYMSVVGFPLATAQADLKGFSTVNVTYSCGGGTPGNVLAQSPGVTPEASYPPGTPITLTVQQDACGTASATASASSTP